MAAPARLSDRAFLETFAVEARFRGLADSAAGGVSAASSRSCAGIGCGQRRGGHDAPGAQDERRGTGKCRVAGDFAKCAPVAAAIAATSGRSASLPRGLTL